MILELCMIFTTNKFSYTYSNKFILLRS